MADAITGPVRAEDSPTALSALLDAMPIAAAIADSDGCLTHANCHFTHLFGHEVTHLSRTAWDPFDSPPAQALLHILCGAFRTARTTGRIAQSVDSPRRTPSGLKSMEVSVTPCAPHSGAASTYLCTLRDLLQVPVSATALERSQRRLRVKIDAVSEGMIKINDEGYIVLANRAAEHMFGYDEDELLGQPIEVLTPLSTQSQHQAERQRYMKAPIARAMAKRTKLFGRRKDGSQFPVEVSLTPLHDIDENSVLATINDITQKEIAQTELERALSEKTALLKEIHHRVKNSLQVVSSLLRLQARGAVGTASEILEAAQSRINAMALLHQLLYENSTLNEISLRAYLDKLSRLIRATYLSDTDRIQLHFLQASVEPMVDLSTAVSCGLIINELVMNSFKYAYPGGRQGRIDLQLEALEDGGVLVRVNDNGVGLRDARTLLEPTSLGLQLVRELTAQISGTHESLNITHQAGTAVSFEIPSSQVRRFL